MAGILSASAPDASPNTNIWTGVNTSYYAVKVLQIKILYLMVF